MGAFFRFIGEAIRRSIGSSVAGGILLAMGVNIKEITARFLTQPPVWVSYWWTPWVFVFGATLFLAYVFYRRVLEIESAYHTAHLRGDITIKAAVDYIVNDSAVILQRPSSPVSNEASDASGRAMPYRGIEHVDAFYKLNEKLAAGELEAWGLREIYPPRIFPAFENFPRKIERGFWDRGYLDHLMCLMDNTVPHTRFSDPNYSAPSYSGLMLNEEQVHRVWPRKTATRQFWERYVFKKKPLTYRDDGILAVNYRWQPENSKGLPKGTNASGNRDKSISST